jgi:hypothetical protein
MAMKQQGLKSNQNKISKKNLLEKEIENLIV